MNLICLITFLSFLFLLLFFSNQKGSKACKDNQNALESVSLTIPQTTSDHVVDGPKFKSNYFDFNLNLID
jgi:hypothetical protein